MRLLAWVTLAAIVPFAGCSDPEEVAATDTQDKNPPEGYNRLYFESSPYLKLHEKNPVDWYPWGDEAFERAQKEDKLVFLSIGYSTCHWCHVMEEESFADQEVADVLNADYIAIKVDREQMPDVDHIYMQVTQAMIGRGGWPNTLLLTPDRKPVFAATYIPKETLIELLTQGKQIWIDERDAILEQGDEIARSIRAYVARTNAGIVTDANVHIAAAKFMETYDAENGGFSVRPKFPSAINLVFLLRASERTGNEEYKNAALKTLTKMRHGGIYDQVGFGFHRYSVDEFWRVPHFEKMLYDQAAHVLAYTEGYQVSREGLFKRTAEEILAYVSRDMSDKDGGFWSAQDADSEGEEGKFYVWTEDELKALLTDEEFGRVKEWFMTTETGNFLDEATQELTGSNIFELKPGTADSPEFRAVRDKILKERIKRIPPLTDDKVLTDWNGLMIAAYARAGVAFDEPKWIERAQKAVKFIRNRMLSEDGSLAHSYREGKTQGAGQLSDYASMIWGLVELYEADFDTAHLELATQLAKALETKFHDSTAGGFYMTAEGEEVAIARAKVATDSALPSGNAIAAYSLVRLGRILANNDFEELGKKTVEAYGGDIETAPSAFLGLLLSTDFLAGPTTEVVVVGERKEALKMIRKMQSIYSPRTVFVLKDPNDADRLTKIAPYTEFYVSQDGKATAYVCQNYTCELPTTDVDSALASIKRANTR